MIIFLLLLLLIAPASMAQDFEDVLPEGDYYHIQFIDYKAIDELKFGKSPEATSLIRYLKRCNYPPVGPDRFVRGADMVVFVSFVSVDSIVEDVYKSEDVNLFQESNDLTSHDLRYEDDEQKMVANIEELLETVVFVKINSLKDLLNAGLEVKSVNDLKKGAIVAYGISYGTASAFMYFVKPDTLVISTNKNILSKIDKVAQGLLPPFRGTKMQRLLKANIKKDSLGWQIKNSGLRVDGWREYAEKKGSSESLKDELEKARVNFPSFTVTSHYYNNKTFNENRTYVFGSNETAQKFCNEEGQKQISRISIIPMGEESIYAKEIDLLEAKKFRLQLSSNRVYASRSISVKEYIADNKELKKQSRKVSKEYYEKLGEGK